MGKTLPQKLIKLAKGKMNKYFKDQLNDIYISAKVKGKRHIFNVKSKFFKKWLNYIYYNEFYKPASTSTIQQVKDTLTAIGQFEGAKINLFNRVASKDGEIYYDLANEDNDCIKITPGHREYIKGNDTPILFRRYNHQKEQVSPLPFGKGDPKLILDYLNIEKDSEEALLLLVYIASCFIPDIDHPILVVHGEKGSAKSTLSKLLQKIIDPTVKELANLPSREDELTQLSYHNWFIFFDNVSRINNNISNTLCKISTGGSHSKRKLFTNEDDHFYTFKQCVGINSLHIPTNATDFLDRSIIIELLRPSDSQRKSGTDILERFEENRQMIFTGFIVTVANAFKLKESINLEKRQRLADFCEWGAAISVALGYTVDDFVKAYENNINGHNEVVLDDNPVGKAIIALMNQRNKWTGTVTSLLEEIKKLAKEQGINTKSYYWPSNKIWLSRRMKEIDSNLKYKGITVSHDRNSKRRLITITKEDRSNEDI